MENKFLTTDLAFPEAVQVDIAGDLVKVKGPKGELERKFISKCVTISKSDKKVSLKSDLLSRNGKREMYTFASHIKNMIHGVQEHYVYKLKVCSGHFPISVKLEKDKFSITNFLGEKIPRASYINEGVKVKQEGDIITVEGPDLETVSQTAANFETATRITNRDRRRFQDGIYLIEKRGVKIWVKIQNLF